MKFAPMAIPAMALLQQYDTRRDILTELAAFWGAQSGRKNQPACCYLCYIFLTCNELFGAKKNFVR